MAMQSQRPLHFFPMAMYTHKLVPPPSTAATAELGVSLVVYIYIYIYYDTFLLLEQYKK